MLRIDSEQDLMVLIRAVNLALGDRWAALDIMRPETDSPIMAEIGTLQAMSDRLDLMARTKHARKQAWRL